MANDAETNNSSVDNDNDTGVYFPPVDSSKVTEVCKEEFKLSTIELFNKYFADKPELDLNIFNDRTDKFDCTSTEWKEITPNVFVRDLDRVARLKDVPFCKQTRVHTSQKMVKDGDKYTISGSTNSLDAPYASYFTVEDVWEIMPLDSNRCVVR